jgi:GrpB-like predicted nucleotidyltransferase (UPF0157 family)
VPDSAVALVLPERDRLRDNPEDRELYATTKRELAARDWKYGQQYADAKTAVVQEILARAPGQAGSPDGHVRRRVSLGDGRRRAA